MLFRSLFSPTLPPVPHPVPIRSPETITITGEEDVKPSKLLGQAMDGVWADLLSSDITKGALIAPQMFYDPMDSINVIINSNMRLQKMLTQNLKPPPKNMLMEGAGALVGIGRYYLTRAEMTTNIYLTDDFHTFDW